MAIHESPSTTEPALPDTEFEWHKILDLEELPAGRVVTKHVGRVSLAVTNSEAGFGCLGNRCPHQGGPLGEGSIEKGWLRCPWHGWDYSPKNGKPPGGFDDQPPAYRTEVREDGVYVALPVPAHRVRTISDVMVETMVNWGVTHVFGMVGHSNLGFADALREAEVRGDLAYVGIRHEGAASFAASAYGKLTGELAACFGIAGPGSTNLLTGLYDAKADRSPVLALSGQVPSRVRGRGAFQDTDLSAAFHDVARYSEVVHSDSRHGELMNMGVQDGAGGAGRGASRLPRRDPGGSSTGARQGRRPRRAGSGPGRSAHPKTSCGVPSSSSQQPSARSSSSVRELAKASPTSSRSRWPPVRPWPPPSRPRVSAQTTRSSLWASWADRALRSPAGS